MIEAVPDWVVFAAVIGVLLLAHATTFIVQKSRRRAEELGAVAEAMKAHYAALEKILNDPAVSNDLRDFMSTFNEGVSTKQVAVRFCQSFFNGGLRKNARSSDEKFSKIDAELRTIQRTRPDLNEAMHTVTSTGMVMVFLRWPETAAYFQKAVLEMSMDSRKEQAFQRAVVSRDDDFHHGGNLATVG